jgi:hypothetical protein
LRCENFRAADAGQAQQPEQPLLIVTFALGSDLRLDDRAVGGQDEIAVAAGFAVLDIVEVEDRITLVEAAADRRDLGSDRVGGDCLGGQQLVDGDPERDPGSGDGRRTGAAVGLNHVAIDDHLALAQSRQVDHRAQAAADQPLDFLGPARLFALRRLAVAAGVGGAGKHPIFGRHPSLALAAQEGRKLVLDRSGDEHARVSEADQARAFGVDSKTGLEAQFAHLVGGASARAHSSLLGEGAGLRRSLDRAAGQS